jgi:hypothetical protein
MKGREFLEQDRLEMWDKLKVFGRYSQFRTTLDQGNYTPTIPVAMPNDNGGIMNSGEHCRRPGLHDVADDGFNFRGSYAMLEDDYSAPECRGRKGLAVLAE